MKRFMLIFATLLLSLTWAQPAVDGIWFGKIEDAGNPCRQYHLKLELEQDATRTRGINGELFLRTPQLAYESLGRFAGTARGAEGYLEWQLSGNLKAHSNLPQTFAGALTLNAIVIPKPPQAPSGTPEAMAFAEGSPLPMSFVKAGAKGANEQSFLDRLDFVWAMQHLSAQQTEHLARYSMRIAKETPSIRRRNKLAIAEGLTIFRATCKNKAK